ncbi:MAG: hypothetical protein K940chlam1_00251 [Candidatus Anoxychlamydiales bacterium]|nr:hypothetical protein [Candidatus Anoxychlamydiales bacterium]NGX35699.1 hypothetical protein [Candidatus Anoxychlamydiales bacterium]
MSMPVSLSFERLEGIKDDISQIEQVSQKLLDDIPHNLSVMESVQTKISVCKYTNHEALLGRVESMRKSVRSSVKKISNLMLNFEIFKGTWREIEKSRSSYSSSSSKIDDLSTKVSNLKNTLDFYANELNNIWQRFRILTDSYSKKILDVNACLEIDKKVEIIFQLKEYLSISPEKAGCKKPGKDVLFEAIVEANERDSATLDSFLRYMPVDLLENKHLVAYLVKPYSANFK